MFRNGKEKLCTQFHGEKNAIYILLQISNFKTVIWSADYYFMIKSKTRRYSLYHSYYTTHYSSTIFKHNCLALNTAWNVSVFSVFLVRIFPNSEYQVSLRFQSDYRKIRTRITPNTDIFYAVQDTGSLSKKCSYSEFSCSVFSRIWTEYEDLLYKSPYLIQMWENAEQKPMNRNTFYAVLQPVF